MYKRSVEGYLDEIVSKYKVITLLGPRQSGKTTLAKSYFAGYQYLSLEDPDTRARAEEDPRSFMQSIKSNVILDEVQNYPDLLSYLQAYIDDPNDHRKIILTGSNSLLLSEKVSQSLAGRSRILNILPMQRSEIPPSERFESVDKTLFFGSYPRVFNEGLDPTDWYGDYYQTYVEKDLRALSNITNLSSFDRFVRLTAGHAGQLMNASALANDVGVSAPTITQWLSLLESSFITFSLQPHFRNFSKRMIKSSKVFFYDTGLLCYLLRINSPSQLESHPLRGNIFENWVIAEHLKNRSNLGQQLSYYFWRDQHGHEVDLVEDKGIYLDLIEIKSGQTFHSKFLDNLKWLGELQGHRAGSVVYGGNNSFDIDGFSVRSWNELFI